MKLDNRYVTLNFRPPYFEIIDPKTEEMQANYFFTYKEMKELMLYFLHSHSLKEFLKN